MKDAPFVDIPLDRAVALVRACQKLNCDTADQLFAMVEKRCMENAMLRAAIDRAANMLPANAACGVLRAALKQH